jgi:hypothetical protein
MSFSSTSWNNIMYGIGIATILGQLNSGLVIGGNTLKNLIILWRPMKLWHHKKSQKQEQGLWLTKLDGK